MKIILIWNLCIRRLKQKKLQIFLMVKNFMIDKLDVIVWNI